MDGPYWGEVLDGGSERFPPKLIKNLALLKTEHTQNAAINDFMIDAFVFTCNIGPRPQFGVRIKPGKLATVNHRLELLMDLVFGIQMVCSGVLCVLRFYTTLSFYFWWVQ